MAHWLQPEVVQLPPRAEEGAERHGGSPDSSFQADSSVLPGERTTAEGIRQTACEMVAGCF